MPPLLVLVLAGCISLVNPAVRDEAVIRQITIGMTTKKDVRNLFGEPNSIMNNPERPLLDMGLPIPPQRRNYEIWNYIYINLETSPATAMPLIGPLLFLGAPPRRTGSATFFFADNGTVTSFNTHQIQGTTTLKFLGQIPRGNQKDRDAPQSRLKTASLMDTGRLSRVSLCMTDRQCWSGSLKPI